MLTIIIINNSHHGQKERASVSAVESKKGLRGGGNLPRMWTEKKSTVQWTSNHRLLYVVRLKYNFNFPLQVFRVFCFFIVVVGWYSWSDPFRLGYTFIYTYLAGDAIWLLSVYSPFSPLSLSRRYQANLMQRSLQLPKTHHHYYLNLETFSVCASSDEVY